MNKLLLVLPILALVGTGLFILSQDKTNLQNLVPVPFEQFLDCYDEVPQYQTYECSTTEGFINTSLKFNEIVNPQSKKASKACVDYTNYLSGDIQMTDFINTNNYFFDCFVSDAAREVANSDECFFKYAYAPIYLKCGGFNIYAYPPYTKFDVNSVDN